MISRKYINDTFIEYICYVACISTEFRSTPCCDLAINIESSKSLCSGCN